MLVEDNLTIEFGLSHTVAFQFIQRKVYSVPLDIFSDISQYVCQLHENTPGFRKLLCSWVFISIDFNAHKADNRGYPVAINVELIEVSVPVVVKVVFHAGDQIIKNILRDTVAVNSVLECEEYGVGRIDLIIAG
jgi:hypothetical protein